MSGFWAAVGALAPPVGVGVVFWLVMRWIVQADRRERAAQARLDALQDAGNGAPRHPQPPPAEPAPGAAGTAPDGGQERPEPPRG